MSEYASLTTRIAIGKTVGLAIGLVGFFTLPALYPEASWQLRWGVLLWYVTVGAVIGLAGVYTRHPVLMLPLPWWVRAPVIGAWLNFVLTFFAYREMSDVIAVVLGAASGSASPYWFVVEGAIVACIIGYFATRFGGEGPRTANP
jgi:hypothetical protein